MQVRKRDKTNNNANSFEFEGSSSKLTESENDDTVYDKNNLSLVYWCCLFIYLFILFDLAVRFQSSCEFKSDFIENVKAVKDKIESLEPLFNDTLARKHLQSISRLGRRPMGSTANEVHTPGYIVNYAQDLVKRYTTDGNSNLVVTIDEQISRLGSFQLFVFGKYHISSIYDRIRNVAIRIHDSHNDIDDVALLINCHYDSSFAGPGASDDLASCVVMLETLHSLLRHQPTSLRSDVIFLFNGAEENILQASHAFVTQHRWSSHVRLFVNLEAAGSGGRQMIFQASPQHPWIVSELGRVLKQPFASVIGQEIFSANLIPSDTDYRIFRDFGGIPGVDLAFITNGYVYHTSYDTEDRIPQTCLRHAGVNLVRVVLHLANIDLVAAQSPDDSVFLSQRVVFFDFLGLFFVSYSEITGLCLNTALILVSVALLVCHSYLCPTRYWKQLFLAILNQVTWLVSSFLLSLLLGYLLHKFGCRMSWYSVRYNVVGLFVVPLLWYFFFYHYHISHFLFRIPANAETAERHRHASIVLMAILTAGLSISRLLSGYFIAMWLLFAFLNEIISKVLLRLKLSSFNNNIVRVLFDAISYSVPMTYYFYMIYTLFDVFIPIMGRSGPTFPDAIVSALTGIVFVVPGLLFAGNVYVTTCASKKWLAFLFLHFSISYYIFIHGTHFGFPYNQSEVAPRKQRILINHVTRNIRNSLGHTQTAESGLWIVSQDSNNVVFLKERLQEVLKIPMQEVFCELRPYCGYPLMFPQAKVVDNSLWIPQSAHKLKPPASIIVLNKVNHVSGMVNVTIRVTGPTHTPIYIMSPDSVRLIGWSLGPDTPKPIDMPSYVHKNYRHYFIFYAYGDKPLTPLTFWMTFLPKIDSVRGKMSGQPDNQVEIAIAAHYLLAMTQEMETLLHLMPKWTVPTTVASTYEHVVVDFGQDLSYDQ